MSALDLTSLALVKEWLAANSEDEAALSQNDQLYMNEIRRVSSMLLGYLQIPTVRRRLISGEVYSGQGGANQMLRQFPVLDVTALAVNGIAISQAASPMGPGFLLEPASPFPPGRPQMISLMGSSFSRGRQNVVVSYHAGYMVSNEAQVIPASANYTITPLNPYGLWASDEGVTFEDGTPLTAVLEAPPAAGQYVAPTIFNSPEAGNTDYTFSEADAGKAIKLNYSFIPFAIEGAATQMVCERLSYRGRIGQTSKSLAGQETVSFETKALPDYVTYSLQPFRNVIPIP